MQVCSEEQVESRNLEAKTVVQKAGCYQVTEVTALAYLSVCYYTSHELSGFVASFLFSWLTTVDCITNLAQNGLPFAENEARLYRYFLARNIHLEAKYREI